MAFFGIFIMWILFLIFIGIIIFSIAALVLGVVIRKHKKLSRFLFVLSFLGFLIIITTLLKILVV